MIPKGKKAYAKGRPIVPCSNRWLCRLHKATGRLIADITARVFKSRTFDAPTTMQAARELAAFQRLLKKRKDPGELVIFNRDLAGVFTSILRDQIISSIRFLLQEAARERTINCEPQVWWTVFIHGARRPCLPGRR